MNIDNINNIRNKVKTVKIGNVLIGGNNPISIQSMTNTDTRDIKSTVEQIKSLEDAGVDIVRLAVLDIDAAKAIKSIKEQTRVPLIADIHFDYRLALESMKSGIDSLRLNPGNIKDKEKVKEVIKEAKNRNLTIRVGVNGGSLDRSIYKEVTPENMVKSAAEHIKLMEDLDFTNIKVSLKSSDIKTTIDANTLLSTFDHISRTKDYINVVVASKHLSLQWLDQNKAIEHCRKGIGILDFASNDKGNPDIVLASAGDTPNLEILAASILLRKNIPNIKVRVVNVIDLMRLIPNTSHPHGLTDVDYDKIFTKDKPIIFAFHGYPNLIHELTYKRANQDLHVRGYMEEGAITTSFDMRVLNKIDRYNLCKLAIKHLKLNSIEAIKLNDYCDIMLAKHKKYIKEHGVDMEEVVNFEFDFLGGKQYEL